jgi:hypothetical protein
METANFASGKLWSVSKPKIKKKGPDTGPFGYFLDFVIFFFGAILVGVSTAVPVAVEPGWSTPTPVDPGCGAGGGCAGLRECGRHREADENSRSNKFLHRGLRNGCYARMNYSVRGSSRCATVTSS